MKLQSLLSVVVAFAVLTGCYDTKQDAKGRTVKINRFTGEMSVIDGDKIIKLKTEKDVKAEQEATEQLGESMTWTAIPILNKYANTTLKTKWSDGNIYYQLYIDKNLRDIANYNAELAIELYDTESFIIRAITVRVNRMVVAVDSDGRTIDAMQYKEKMSMSENAYKKIVKWDIIWSGFNY
jgi:hypothetical protein